MVLPTGVTLAVPSHRSEQEASVNGHRIDDRRCVDDELHRGITPCTVIGDRHVPRSRTELCGLFRTLAGRGRVQK